MGRLKVYLIGPEEYVGEEDWIVLAESSEQAIAKWLPAARKFFKEDIHAGRLTYYGTVDVE